MTMVSSAATGSWASVASAEPIQAPVIDQAAKQQCMQAERVLLDCGVSIDRPKSGHCWCSTAQVRAVDHHVCCKCGDRYVPSEE